MLYGKTTRRNFIISTSKFLSSILGIVALGNSNIFPPKDTNTFLGKLNFGLQKNGKSKVLVAYESQFGSTKEVANFIGKELSQKGNYIDIKNINEVDDLSIYDKFIIGSAIQYDDWMNETKEFVTTNQKIFSELPVAFFFTCLILSKKTKEAEQQALGYSDKLYNLVPKVKPVSIGQFAGVLDYSKMSFFLSIIARGMFAILGIKEGDYRDWDAIHKWVKSINF